MATTYDGKTINFDSSDLKGMVALMDRANEFSSAVFGKNTDGETVMISVNKDNVTYEVFQDNGWAEEHIYYRDGTAENLIHKS